MVQLSTLIRASAAFLLLSLGACSDRAGGDASPGATRRVAGLYSVLVDELLAHLLQHGSVLGDGLGDRFVGEAGVRVRAKRSRFDGHYTDALRRNLFPERFGDASTANLVAL